MPSIPNRPAVNNSSEQAKGATLNVASHQREAQELRARMAEKARQWLGARAQARQNNRFVVGDQTALLIDIYMCINDLYDKVSEYNALAYGDYSCDKMCEPYEELLGKLNDLVTNELGISITENLGNLDNLSKEAVEI